MEAEKALWDPAEIPVRYQGLPEEVEAEPQRENRNLEDEFGSLPGSAGHPLKEFSVWWRQTPLTGRGQKRP